MSDKRTIYKYHIHNNAVIPLPVSHRILDVQYQGDQLCMWALVDPEGEPLGRVFRVFGTGWPMTKDDERHNTYLATVQRDGFVWHVFVEEP